jgi:hypothetical protein
MGWSYHCVYVVLKAVFLAFGFIVDGFFWILTPKILMFSAYSFPEMIDRYFPGIPPAESAAFVFSRSSPMYLFFTIVRSLHHFD